MVNRSDFGAKCIALISDYVKDYDTEHMQYVAEEEWDNTITYRSNIVIDREFFLGYFDIINKKFVINPQFQLNRGINDKIQLSTAIHHPLLDWIRFEKIPEDSIKCKHGR